MKPPRKPVRPGKVCPAPRTHTTHPWSLSGGGGGGVAVCGAIVAVVYGATQVAVCGATGSANEFCESRYFFLAALMNASASRRSANIGRSFTAEILASGQRILAVNTYLKASVSAIIVVLSNPVLIA
jgi:hypothetical protein